MESVLPVSKHSVSLGEYRFNGLYERRPGFWHVFFWNVMTFEKDGYQVPFQLALCKNLQTNLVGVNAVLWNGNGPKYCRKQENYVEMTEFVTDRVPVEDLINTYLTTEGIAAHNKKDAVTMADYLVRFFLIQFKVNARWELREKPDADDLMFTFDFFFEHEDGNYSPSLPRIILEADNFIYASFTDKTRLMLHMDEQAYVYLEYRDLCPLNAMVKYANKKITPLVWYTKDDLATYFPEDVERPEVLYYDPFINGDLSLEQKLKELPLTKMRRLGKSAEVRKELLNGSDALDPNSEFDGEQVIKKIKKDVCDSVSWCLEDYVFEDEALTIELEKNNYPSMSLKMTRTWEAIDRFAKDEVGKLRILIRDHRKAVLQAQELTQQANQGETI